MFKSIQREILEIHQFFQGWFNGQVSDDEKILNRLTRVLAKDFTIINPAGRLIHRDDLISMIQAAYHTHKGMRIWIENVQILHKIGEITIAAYEEWQIIGREVTVRLTTATFKFQPGAPNELIWLHVHESWMHPPNHQPTDNTPDPTSHDLPYSHDRS